MGQAPIQPQLAQRQIAIERILGNGADRRHDAQRNGQVVMAALLGQVGRRQIDGNALGRQADAGGKERGAYPLARFLDRFVGQPDQDEIGIARRDLHLDVDRNGLDARKCYSGDTGDHAHSP